MISTFPILFDKMGMLQVLEVAFQQNPDSETFLWLTFGTPYNLRSIVKIFSSSPGMGVRMLANPVKFC